MPAKEGRFAAGTALVIVPAGVNYAYEVHGRRIAEALRFLGFQADVCDLSSCPGREYDWCFLTNITEIIVSYCRIGAASILAAQPERPRRGDPDVPPPISPEQGQAALDALRRLHDHCRNVVCCPMEATGTHWYAAIEGYCQATGVDTILDFGLTDQSATLAGSGRAMYHFLVNGLTPSERRVMEEAPDDDRSIPWSFVGHRTQQRAMLVDQLVSEVDPCGFVYLPRLTTNPSRGSPHLNERQFATVLRRCRYHVWCSHHPHFYMEVERFRMALLAGCVPIKVMPSSQDLPAGLVFRSLVVSEAELHGRLRHGDFRSEVRRGRKEFCNLPSLTDSLAAFFASRYRPAFRSARNCRQGSSASPMNMTSATSPK